MFNGDVLYLRRDGHVWLMEIAEGRGRREISENCQAMGNVAQSLLTRKALFSAFSPACGLVLTCQETTGRGITSLLRHAWGKGPLDPGLGYHTMHEKASRIETTPPRSCHVRRAAKNSVLDGHHLQTRKSSCCSSSSSAVFTRSRR